MKKRYKTLLDDDLLFGYKEIVLYYESKVKRNPKGFRVSKIKKSLKQLAVYQNDLQTEIKSPSLIYHLRNAYAHNCVEKEKIKGVDFLCFIDRKYYKKSNKVVLTMLGQIPYDVFLDFIGKLKDARTPEEGNSIEPFEEIIY